MGYEDAVVFMEANNMEKVILVDEAMKGGHLVYVFKKEDFSSLEAISG